MKLGYIVMLNMIKEYDGNPYGRLVEMAKLLRKMVLVKEFLYISEILNV